MLHILFFCFFIQFSRSRAHRAPATSRFDSCFPHISSRAFRFSRCRGCLYTIQVLAVTSAATTISPFDDIHSRCGGGTLPLVGSNGLEPSTSRLSGVRSNHLSYEPISVAGSFQSAKPVGGDEQNRTVDPLLARQVLSQLSYAPILGLCLGESTLLKVLFSEGPQN